MTTAAGVVMKPPNQVETARSSLAASTCFQIMFMFSWLFSTLFCGALGGHITRAEWLEKINQVKVHGGALRQSFYRMPIFLHSPGALIDRELFRPVSYRQPMPTGLDVLLLPRAGQTETVPGSAGHAVQVHCGVDKISVRLDRMGLRPWNLPYLFRLGSCEASAITPRFIYFHYRLTECGVQSKVSNGQLVYTFILHYSPPHQGIVIRVLPLRLPIVCHYNRFHYSYKVGFQPQVQYKTYEKRFRSQLFFSLSVCNEQWEPLPPGHKFPLGQPVYFVAQTGALLAGERLYVDSCYATPSKDPNSMPRMDIIKNYGCMTDSRREGSSSKFFRGGANAVKFSVDAFLFKVVSQVLYLHCSMSVGLTTSYTSKSCNYNKNTGRWEELETFLSVCSCCDSMCTDIQEYAKNIVSSPSWFIVPGVEEKPNIRAISLQLEEGRTRKEPEERKYEKIDKQIKVQTVPQKTRHEDKEKETIQQDSGVSAEETEESVVSQHVKEEDVKDDEHETENVVVEKAESQQVKFDSSLMFNQTSIKENVTALAEEDSVSGSSSEN